MATCSFRRAVLSTILSLFLSLASHIGGDLALAEEPPAPPSTPIERGIQLLNEERLDEALKAFEEAAAEAPEDPLPHYYKGVIYHRKRQPVPALTALNKALSLRPGMEEAILEIGIIFEEVGRFDRAREAYQAVARGREGSPFVKEARERLRKLEVAEHYRKGGRLFQEKRYGEALKELEIVLSLNPQDADARFAAGLAYQRLGRLNEAIETFKKVIEIDPGRIDAYFQIAVTYDAQAAYEEAIEAYKKVISLAPDSPQAKEAKERLPEGERRLKTRRHFEAAAELIRKEQWPEALKETQAILAIEPKNPNALFNLGLIHHQLHEDDQAIEALKKALEIDPDFQKAHYQLGVIYDDQWKFREAVPFYERVMAIDARTSEAEKAGERLDILKSILEGEEKVQVAKELMEREDFTGAIREIEGLIAVKPDDPNLYFTLATLYVRIGRPKEAASSLEKAVSLNPKEIEMVFLLGKIYEGLREYGKAAEAYNTAVSRAKGTPREEEARSRAREMSKKLHFSQGKRFLETGDFESSLREIEAVLEIDPEDPVALFNIGVVYDRLNRPAEGEAPLRKAVSLAPDYVAAYLQLGLVLQRLRRFGEAREALEKVIEIQGEGREARIARARIEQLKEFEILTGHIEKGIKLMEERRWEEARKEIDAVISVSPNNYIGYFYLSIILDRLGITDEAKVAIKKAIEINPRFAQGYLHLGDILLKEGDFEEARKAYNEVVALGEDIPEAEMAMTRLRGLRPLQGTFTLTQGYNSNIAFGAEERSSIQSGYDLSLNYLFLRRKSWNLSVRLALNEDIYYQTQLEGNGYTLSLNGTRRFSGDRVVSGGLSYNKSYFEGDPASVTIQFTGDARTEPRSIPTEASLRYVATRSESFRSKANDMERHQIAASLSQKFSLRDTVTASYTFGVQKNLHILGHNYANRTHTLSLSYNRPLLADLAGNLGYSASLVQYSNPDSTTLFQRFRRNINQVLKGGLSLRLSEKVNLSFNYSYTVSRTNLPRPTAEELQRLEDLLASPIPNVGGGYRQHAVNLSISTTF